jgi:hypothetical protein
VADMKNDEREKNRPTKIGWFWFYYRINDTEYFSWAPAKVVFVDSFSEYLRWGLENTDENWKPVKETEDHQWGPEIIMVKP